MQLTVREWTIRPLSAADSLDELTQLIHAAYAPHLENGLRFVGTHQSVTVTAERLASGDAFVAEGDARHVGTVTVRAPRAGSSVSVYRDPDTWSLSQLAVLPEFKGRGLGRALHDVAVQHAIGRGAKVVALDTAAPASGLISLYERWGYRLVGKADWRPETNYESVLMARSISAT